ncbi:MAG: hypothetical protein MJZ35_09275 [Bacteroidaceae bacterium]|nr:hypothetical protein [Bacteroidaceae bacterium]
MKYTKLFMLALGAMFVASCSNDDEKVNSLETTVGFQSETLTIKESVGRVQIPVAIEGARNGNVSFEVVAEGTGANPAKEGVNFRITDNTLSLLAKNDTTKSAVINIEFETIDDSEINDPREVTLTIKSADGAKIKNNKLVVTLRDNDAAFYEKFFGRWTLTAKDEDDNPITKTIIIRGAVDENDTEYDHILWVTAPALFNVGVNLDCEWPMEYTFDKATKTGTLSHLMNQNTVATYGNGAYEWVFKTDNGESYTDDPIVAEWKLGEGDSFPTEISWGEDHNIWLYQPGAGWWAMMYDVKITKQ